MNKEMESIQQALLIMTYKTDKIYLYSYYTGQKRFAYSHLTPNLQIQVIIACTGSKSSSLGWTGYKKNTYKKETY